jgi:hypothetical protein
VDPATETEEREEEDGAEVLMVETRNNLRSASVRTYTFFTMV